MSREFKVMCDNYCPKKNSNSMPCCHECPERFDCDYMCSQEDNENCPYAVEPDNQEE